MTERDRLFDFAQDYLKALIAEAAESLDANFDSATPFGELGIDSFRVLRIVKSLENDFGRLPKTLLFENYHVNDLATYFVDRHADTLRKLMQARGHVAMPVNTATAPSSHAPLPAAPAAKPVADAAPAIVAAAPVVVAQAPARTSTPEGPILGFEQTLRDDPRLGEWVRKTFEEHKNDGSVSRGTRNIAPNLFIGSRRTGYFHYARSGDRLLAYGYSGPDDDYAELAAEFCRHAIQAGLHPNLLSAQAVPATEDLRFSATPFGVLQRVVDLKDFTLAGASMRRLRYLVNKFEKEGACRTEEFRCGGDPATTQAIAGIIDAWCANRTMVNPLIHKVREEIVAGTLDPGHRLFVTYVDDVMQNVIMITPLAARLGGYLMDLEFYGREMPLGGLEFAICQIIETLKAEGCDVLSMGGTYGCKLEESDLADPDIDRALDELREQNLFNDAGNLQFKNKFRPENHTIHLCRPQGTGEPQDVIDLIMMIADPDRMQTSDAARHTDLDGAPEHVADVGASTPAATVPVGETAGEPVLGIRGVARSYRLAESGFNPLRLSHAHVEFDLKTDSWAQLHRPAIEQRSRHLHARLYGPVDTQATLAAVFPFRQFVLTRSGRTAERVLFRAWPRKGVVLQNLLFPTNLFHQIDNGFIPREVAKASVFAVGSPATDKGELDLDALRAALANPGEIAMVCVEIANNASGGQSVSPEHLQAVKALLAPHAIPLVVDATRVLDNVAFGASARTGAAMWQAVRDLLAPADVVVASLPKNFGVTGGGLVAARDAALQARLEATLAEEGCALGVQERKLLGLALQDRAYLEQQIPQRQAAVRHLAATLAQQGVPVVPPTGAHCVLIDVAAIPEFAALREPVPSFLAWLYIETGIRAAGHNAGLSRQHALAGVVRLALPLGITLAEADEIARRIGVAFVDKRNLPDLETDPKAATGDIHAPYRLRGYLRPIAAVEAQPAAGADFAEVVPSQPDTTPDAVASGPAMAPAGIAIVGMAGRYPKANNPRELWRLLLDSRDCIEDLPDTRIAMRQGITPVLRYRGGFIEDVDAFDAAFFGISRRDAAVMDPQERQFLEVAHEAMEDAGYVVDALGGDMGERNIGVFVGAVWSSYQMFGLEEKAAGRQVNPSSFLWSIANRVSYWMDLHGPSLTLDTACSASLTAIKLACDAILSGECRAAIAGGVNLDLHQSKYDINSSGGSLSRDGVCRAFGQGANGYVSGEGVGALFLKPLEQAIADRDHVYGVIRSVVVTHSGRTSAYTVPNPRTQAELVSRALAKADIDARTIGYIEGHGTGTDLGDSIEIAGLTRAFAPYDVPVGSCPIGSIKTNIGHLEAASGIVGVQKILLQMQHRMLVPSLHAEVLNENIDFDSAPFRVQRTLSAWDEKVVDGTPHPRRAGISAIGIGGGNAHVVLEEYVAPADAGPAGDRPLRVVPLSARTPEQLQAMAGRLLALLRDEVASSVPFLTLDNVAFTLTQGRRSFDHRAAFLAHDLSGLAERLAAFVAGSEHDDVLVGQVGNARSVTAMLDAQEREDFVSLMLQRGDPRRLGRLWSDGLIADARRIGPDRGRRIPLPTYPFTRTRYWIAEGRAAASGAAVSVPVPAPEAAPAATRPEARPEAATQSSRYRFWIDEAEAVDGVQVDVPVPEKAALFVRQLLADALEVSMDTLRSDDGLLEIGLNSLDMAGLTTELKARFGPKFSPTTFFECRTIGDFTRMLAEQYHGPFEAMRFAKVEAVGEEAIASSRRPVRVDGAAAGSDLHLQDAEAPLALPDTPWPAIEQMPASLRILLTGATGFLGMHVLHALCANDPEVRVRCLVRAPDVDVAWARLRDRATRCDLVLDERRVEVLCGDVGAERLGLSEAQWDACCDEIDQIVHSAAHVNHIEGYASFRDATVGMKEIVRLAASRRPKLVQFMSSTATCILKTGDTISVHEHEAFIAAGETVYGGYGQSKWVQERYLQRAAAVGVPYVIYRFGELSGSSRTGCAQTDDMLHRLLQMRLTVGCREKVSNDVLDAVPVDIAAALIAGASRRPDLWNSIVHGTHLTPCPIARVYRMAEQRLGRTFAPVTRQHYLNACFEYVRRIYERSPLDGFVLECVLRDAEGASRQRKIMDGYFAVLFPFEQTHFAQFLEALGVALPAWDALLAAYFDRWSRDDSDFFFPLGPAGMSQEGVTAPAQRSAAVAAPNINKEPALERVDGI